MSELEARIDDLSGDELDELERVGRLAHGAYTTASYTLREKVHARRSTLTAAGAAPPDSADDVDSTDASESARQRRRPRR